MGNTDNLPPDRLADAFMTNACQYYAAARFAMHAQCIPVCGILFHHTVEMFLKAGLAQKRKLHELENMRHDLKKLWRAFKTDFPSSVLDCHDETILCVNKFGAIRYPEGMIEHGASMSAEWSGAPAKGTMYRDPMLIGERTRTGVKAAQRRGEKFGRKLKLTADRLAHATNSSTKAGRRPRRLFMARS